MRLSGVWPQQYKKFQITNAKYQMVRQAHHHPEPGRRANHNIEIQNPKQLGFDLIWNLNFGIYLAQFYDQVVLRICYFRIIR